MKYWKEEIIKEFDANSDISEEEWSNLSGSEREKAAFLHVLGTKMLVKFLTALSRNHYLS